MFKYPRCDVVNCAPYSISLPPGAYNLQVWGAAGGNSDLDSSGNRKTTGIGYGGKGGFSQGELLLTAQTLFYVYVGSKGDSVPGYNLNVPGTFGGGGGINTPNGNGVRGGGASDIRLKIGDLNTRIIVAGGGGGASGGNTNLECNGGDGGGGSGFKGIGDTGCINSNKNGCYADPGNQQGPGINSFGYSGNSGGPGSFGYGGTNKNCCGSNYGGAGGGGWFGGAGGEHRSPGGGGSGYILNEVSYKPNGYNIDSRYYLKNPVLLSGRDTIPPPVPGYTGYDNGYVRITQIYSKKENYCTYRPLYGSSNVLIWAVYITSEFEIT